MRLKFQAGACAPALTPVLYGYDVVEYFSLAADAAGVVGSEEYQHNLTAYDASTAATKMTNTTFTFFFSSKQNQEAFAADPYKYAPQWGGF